MNRRSFLRGAGATLAVSPWLYSAGDPAEIELTNCVILAAENATAREKKALSVLREEVQKRSLLKWPIESRPSRVPSVAIYAGTRTSPASLGRELPPL